MGKATRTITIRVTSEQASALKDLQDAGVETSAVIRRALDAHLVNVVQEELEKQAEVLKRLQKRGLGSGR